MSNGGHPMDDDIRKDFPGGYYTITWKDSDLREPPFVNLYDPDGKPLNIHFDADACFKDIRIVEGIQRKIIAVEDHLKDLKKALSILSKGI
jgi:hypothetical protein